jgi:hypothetical protein
MDRSSIIVTGLKPQVIINVIKLQTFGDILKIHVNVPEDYKIEDTSEKVEKTLV